MLPRRLTPRILEGVWGDPATGVSHGRSTGFDHTHAGAVKPGFFYKI